MTFLVSIMKTLLTVNGIPFASTLLASRLSNMSYNVETFLSASAIIGKSTLTLLTSLISPTHFSWSFKSFAESPITFTPREAKSEARRATSPSSVVQTGAVLE